MSQISVAKFLWSLPFSSLNFRLVFHTAVGTAYQCVKAQILIPENFSSVDTVLIP